MRTLLGHSGGYHAINREERNLAAIFYHTLLLGDNLERFKQLVGCPYPTVEEEMGIYFEYAYIRDLWNAIDSTTGATLAQLNAQKRTLILNLLQPRNREKLEALSIKEFNEYFGAVPEASPQYIMSPSRWSMSRFDGEIIDTDDFLSVCRFKWCFNAKPDIVIHTTHNTAICIEAKLESAEGRYSSSKEEKAIFRTRGCQLEGQLGIQQKILKELLGVDTQFLFLVQQKGRSVDGCTTFTWKEVFQALDTSACPPFIRQWVERICK